MTFDLAAFDTFFQGAFQRALDVTEIPGMECSTWDRKAAYLLWIARKKETKELEKWHLEKPQKFQQMQIWP